MKITKKLKEWTDEQVLMNFLEFLREGRVRVTSGFLRQPDSGLITHQVIQFSAGECSVASDPEELDIPLVVASAKDLTMAVN